MGDVGKLSTFESFITILGRCKTQFRVHVIHLNKGGSHIRVHTKVLRNTDSTNQGTHGFIKRLFRIGVPSNSGRTSILRVFE